MKYNIGRVKNNFNILFIIFVIVFISTNAFVPGKAKQYAGNLNSNFQLVDTNTPTPTSVPLFVCQTITDMTCTLSDGGTTITYQIDMTRNQQQINPGIVGFGLLYTNTPLYMSYNLSTEWTAPLPQNNYCHQTEFRTYYKRNTPDLIYDECILSNVSSSYYSSGSNIYDVYDGGAFKFKVSTDWGDSVHLFGYVTFSSTPISTPTPSLTPTPTPSSNTLSLQPNAANGADAYLQSTASTTNYGTSTTMGIGESNNVTNEYTRSLIKFDLSSIPPNATITSATLSLWTAADLSNTTRNIQVYRLKRPFNEAQATWNKAQTGVNWQTAGASGANDRETTSIGIVQIPATQALSTEKQISLNAAKIQEYTNGTFTNNGFIIIANGELNDRFNYKTSDNGSGAQRPKLW